MKTNPTPYQDVNETLDLLLIKAKNVLGIQFVGMYLYGSLSIGDFDPETSDIDFLIVIEDILPDEVVSELEAVHNLIWKTKSKWVSKLEGSYVHKELIRRHDPSGAPCPTVNEGKFYLDKRGSDWIIQRHVIRKYGVILDGPDPKLLIDYVSPDDIRNAVLGTLREWWFPMLNDPKWLRGRGGEYHAYAVISMCRALHALETGTIISKPKAVQWAQVNLGESWNQLIDKAIKNPHLLAQDALLDDALDFIQFTKEMTITP